jgi:hypothetical protein
MWITYDFECVGCGEIYEDTIKKPHGAKTFAIGSECPHCSATNTKPLLSAPGLAAHSMQSREMQMHSLKERSRKHSEKMNKSNTDEIHAKWNNGKGAAIG